MPSYLQSPHFEHWQQHKRWHFYRCAVLANLLHIALMLLGFRRLMQLLQPIGSTTPPTATLKNEEEARTLKKAVNPIFKRIRKSRYLWSNCLSSSILLYLLLKREGLPTQLIIGTKKENSIFKAHAWVEYNHFPLNENKRIRAHYHVFEHDFTENYILSF